jgi:hypothetical protein
VEQVERVGAALRHSDGVWPYVPLERASELEGGFKCACGQLGVPPRLAERMLQLWRCCPCEGMAMAWPDWLSLAKEQLLEVLEEPAPGE